MDFIEIIKLASDQGGLIVGLGVLLYVWKTQAKDYQKNLDNLQGSMNNYLSEYKTMIETQLQKMNRQFEQNAKRIQGFTSALEGIHVAWQKHSDKMSGDLSALEDFYHEQLGKTEKIFDDLGKDIKNLNTDVRELIVWIKAGRGIRDSGGDSTNGNGNDGNGGGQS